MEYVVTVVIFVIILLVLPTKLALKSVEEADEAKHALSSAYDDLEKRVLDRTRQLADANEQLKRAMEGQRASEKEYRLLSSHCIC